MLTAIDQENLKKSIHHLGRLIESETHFKGPLTL